MIPATGRKALILSDGRPGHFRQSAGIAAALNKRINLTVTEITIARRSYIPKYLLQRSAQIFDPDTVLRTFYDIDWDSIPKPDVVISAGGVTLSANVAFSKLLEVPSIFSGSIRNYSAAQFAAVCTAYRSLAGGNIVQTLTPTPVDPDSFPKPRSFSCAADLTHAKVTLLVGGPTPYAAFNETDWIRLTEKLRLLVEEFKVSITVVTSLRTPDLAYRHFRRLQDFCAGKIKVVDYREAGPNSIEPHLDCDLVLATSDSMSMISEAVASKRAVIVLAPESVKRFRDDIAVEDLKTENLLCKMSIVQASPDQISSAAVRISPLKYNHLERLADKLLAIEKIRNLTLPRALEPGPSNARFFFVMAAE